MKKKQKKLFFISNLAWDKKYQDKVFKLIKKNKIQGIDFAPLQISQNWKNIINKVKTCAIKFRKNNIKVNAVQGIFFKKNFNLFRDIHDIEKIINHINIIIKICKILNCRKIILGSSEFRNKNNLKNKEADKIFVNFLKKLIPYLKKNKIFLCLETIPKQYNETYLFNFNYTLSIIKKINSRWVGINFDTSLFHYNKFNINKFKKNINLIKNVQVTEKKFHFFLKPSKKNVNFCKQLKKINKIKNVSLEIINNRTELNKIDLSLKNLVDILS